MSLDAFVSYATPDRAVTMALVEDLEARGMKCWIAPRDVPGGSKYAEVILKALAESKVFLLVFSESSNASEHVQREVERALNASKTIVPVRIADILPSGAMDYYLATLHWIDAFGAAKKGAFEVVAQALARTLGKELATPGAAPTAVGATLPTPADTAQAPKATAAAKAGAAGRMGWIAAALALLLAGMGAVAGKVFLADDGKKDHGEPSLVGDHDRSGSEQATSPSPGPAHTPQISAGGTVPDSAAAAAAAEGVSKLTLAEKETTVLSGGAQDPVGQPATTLGTQATPSMSASAPTRPAPDPPDPLAEALAAARKAWTAGERRLALDSLAPVLALSAAELDKKPFGNAGEALIREMIIAAADDAETGDPAAAGSFEELDHWRALVDFSEQLVIEDLEPQRQSFQIGWEVARAESQWADGQRETAAKSLAQLVGRGETVVQRLRSTDDALGKRLSALLNEVAEAATAGRLGVTQVLADVWRPALRLAVDGGSVQALTVLAALAWKADDRQETATLLANYEKAARGVSSLDAGVASLLTDLISKARAEEAAGAGAAASAEAISLLAPEWQPAYDLAYAHEIPGALEVLAELTHRRNPGEAVALYRSLYKGALEQGSLRRQIGFCLQMLKRYEFGEEAAYYREQLQDACDLTLKTMDQPTGGGELIEEIPELREVAAAGVPAAQYIMGDLLASGKGMEKDDKAAFAFYKKSADSGYARAKYAVGECLRDARGTEGDQAGALRVWRAMSDEEVAEVPQTLYSLAQLLPEGTERNEAFQSARQHYEAKVEGGELALFGSGLGYMLVNGFGGEVEAKRGFELLQKSAEQGSAFGAFLAGMILVGEDTMFVTLRQQAGLERDEVAGTELIKRAAREGYPNALQWCQLNNVEFDK